MQTANDILSQIAWREEKEQTGSSIGTLQTAFSDCELLLVKTSKKNALRATVMIKKDGKVTNAICSEAMTPLVRQGRITLEHIVNFPLVYNKDKNSIFIGFPSQGWVEAKSITAKEFKATAVNLEDLV
jgi:hypothetical protein